MDGDARENATELSNEVVATTKNSNERIVCDMVEKCWVGFFVGIIEGNKKSLLTNTIFYSESNNNRLVRVVCFPLGGTFARDLNDAVLQQDRFKVGEYYDPFD